MAESEAAKKAVKIIKRLDKVIQEAIKLKDEIKDLADKAESK